jgi:glycosyltransferase involved in cell wall biosynthesis
MLESQVSVSHEERLASSVTIVICCYTSDRWVTLRGAVEAALDQISLGDELLIVVDHNDALLALCREYFGESIAIPNRHNCGLSGARNTGLEEARGSIIAFLDDDAVPLDGWLDALRSPYSDEHVYGVGGFAKPGWCGRRPRWFPEEFLWVVGCSHRGLPPDRGPVRNVIGANMSFRKTAFTHVGGFAEPMGRIGERPFGCEETEFSIRLQKANPGLIILYEPSSKVEHHIPESRASLGYYVTRCWAEGLSKAEVSRRVGPSRALSAERSYASRVLPRGILKGLRDGVTGDLWGAVRAAAIVLGLATTTAGYSIGTVFPSVASGGTVK